jgi:hypothetical protein
MSSVVALFDRERFEETHRTGGRGNPSLGRLKLRRKLLGKLERRSVETAWNTANTDTDALPSKQTVSSRFISGIRKWLKIQADKGSETASLSCRRPH